MPWGCRAPRSGRHFFGWRLTGCCGCIRSAARWWSLCLPRKCVRSWRLGRFSSSSPRARSPDTPSAREMWCSTGWLPNSQTASVRCDGRPARMRRCGSRVSRHARRGSSERHSARFVESLRDRQTRMIGESAVRDAQRLEAILAEHTEIAEAVRDGDVSRLLDAIKVHLAGTERALAFTAD